MVPGLLSYYILGLIFVTPQCWEYRYASLDDEDTFWETCR